MNNRGVHEDTDSGVTDHTVRSFWDCFYSSLHNYVFQIFGSI